MDFRKLNANIDKASYTEIILSIVMSISIVCYLNGVPSSKFFVGGLKDLLAQNSIYLNLSFFVLFCLSTIFIASVIHTHLSDNKEKDVKSHKEKYQDYFNDVISPKDLQVDQYFNKTKSSSKSHLELTDIVDPKNRTILLSELKGMHSIITGQEKDRLRELYFGMGFVPEIKSRLESSSWLTRVEAIQEVRQFQIRSYYPKVFDMINDAHETVRRNAILSRIVLDPDPINILHDINTPLNSWERHNILSALEKLPSHKVPLFCTLYLEAPMHVEFLKELCLHFHQKTVLEQEQKPSHSIVAI